jgi:hypothetical protein
VHNALPGGCCCCCFPALSVPRCTYLKVVPTSIWHQDAVAVAPCPTLLLTPAP